MNLFNLSPVGVIILEIDRFELLQLRVSVGAVTFQCAPVVEHLSKMF